MLASRIEDRREQYLSWEDPGLPAAVHFNLRAASQISLLAFDGLRALPRNGLEVGGLLLGRIATSGTRPEVFIEDCRPIESEHRYGPSYRLSENDRASWREATSGRADQTFEIVGLFRSATISDFEVNDQDRELIESLFIVPERLVVVIKPAMNGEHIGEITLWHDGMWLRLGKFPTPILKASGAAAVEKAPWLAAVLPPRQSSRRFPARWILAPLVVMVLIAAAWVYSNKKGAERITSVSDQRKASAFAQNPPSGTPSDVAVHPAAAGTNEDPQPTASAQPAQTSVVDTDPVPTTAPVPAPQTPIADTEPRAHDELPPSPARPSTVSQPANAPEFEVRLEHSGGSVLARPLHFISPRRWLPGLRHATRNEPPQVRQGAQPYVPAKLLRTLRSGERVDVKIDINRAGKVVNAVVTSRQKRGWLTASVMAAAYQWEFQPARLNSKPVESTAVLHFVFATPQANKTPPAVSP